MLATLLGDLSTTWFGILQRYISFRHVVHQGIWFSKQKLSFPCKQLILRKLENRHFKIILILSYQPFVRFPQKIAIRCFWNQRSCGFGLWLVPGDKTLLHRVEKSWRWSMRRSRDASANINNVSLGSSPLAKTSVSKLRSSFILCGMITSFLKTSVLLWNTSWISLGMPNQPMLSSFA